MDQTDQVDLISDFLILNIFRIHADQLTDSF